MSEMKCKRCGANENRIHGFCSMECETAWYYEDDIRDLTARIAELEEERRWMPVSEPPKVSGKYLLLNIYDDVYPCDFIAGTEIWVLPDYDTVTHWMPLPKLPEVQE